MSGSGALLFGWKKRWDAFRWRRGGQISRLKKVGGAGLWSDDWAPLRHMDASPETWCIHPGFKSYGMNYEATNPLIIFNYDNSIVKTHYTWYIIGVPPNLGGFQLARKASPLTLQECAEREDLGSDPVPKEPWSPRDPRGSPKVSLICWKPADFDHF